MKITLMRVKASGHRRRPRTRKSPVGECLVPRQVLVTGGAQIKCTGPRGRERCTVRHGFSGQVLRRNLSRAQAEEAARKMRARSAAKATRGCLRTGRCPDFIPTCPA